MSVESEQPPKKEAPMSAEQMKRVLSALEGRDWAAATPEEMRQALVDIRKVRVDARRSNQEELFERAELLAGEIKTHLPRLEIYLKENGVEIHKLHHTESAIGTDFILKETERFKREGKAREIELLLDWCKRYIEGSILVDEFAEHTQRREWERDLGTYYGEASNLLVSSNRLAGANVYKSVESIERALQFLEDFSEERELKMKLKNVLEKIKSDVQRYDELKLEEKRELSDKLTNSAWEILKLFGLKTQGH